ncbi:MAG TPA: hypothetical protein VFP12_08380 [Allosphingosinicella sp.]|nr:hypothetical protein [Allosphingosinicella sp.]
MIGMLMGLLAVGAAAVPVQASLLGGEGDKLLTCRMKKFSGTDAQATRMAGGEKFGFFVAVLKKGEFGYREGKGSADLASMKVIDPTGILGSAKINVFIDEEARTALVAGLMVSPQPLMLIVDPRQTEGGEYFSIVFPVDRALEAKGDPTHGGWCRPYVGSEARTRFEAMR